MLAKEIKILNLKKQKDFITKEILEASKLSKDGCALYVFHGLIYLEVKKLLEEEGLEFLSISPDRHGISRTIISNKDIELTEDELKQAMEYDYSQDIEEDFDEDYAYDDCDEYEPIDCDFQA